MNAEARKLDAWRMSDWKEGLAILFFVSMMVLGSCSLLETLGKIGKAVDENREGLKNVVSSIGGVSKKTDEIVSKVGDNLDKVIGAVKTQITSLEGKFREMDKNQDGKIDLQELLGGLLILGGVGGARNVASGRKKKRHLERLYTKLEDSEKRLSKIETKAA